MSIADRIKEVTRGMTQAELAALLKEKNPHRVNSILSGKQRVPEDFLVKFLEVFRVDANWLLLGAGESSKPKLTPREAALLDNYRNCPEDARRNLDATSALLAQFKERAGGTG